MRMHISRHWVMTLGQVAALAAPSIALAGAAFSSGSATWSWDADTASANGGKTTFTISPPSSSSMPTSPTFQLNKSGSFGSATATGKGSLGYVANSTTASWTFAGGTGASQSDPGNTAFPGQTLSKVQFGGLYDVTSPSFGPTATGYFSLTVAGIAGINGSTEIDFNVQWRLGGPSGTLLRSQINDGTTFFGTATSTQSFSKTFTYSTAFSPTTVSSSSNIWVGGFLTLAASNGDSPSDLAPIQFEASAAPPTSTFYGPAGIAVNWETASTWAVPDNPAAGQFAFTEPGALVPTIPNGVGQRARIVNNSSEARGITLANDITLGSLQIDENSGIDIAADSGTVALIMDVPTGNASIHLGALAGRGVANVSTELVLADSVDIRVENDAPGLSEGSELNLFGPVLTTGGPKDINISGGGIVNFNTGNSYGGATNISGGGRLAVNADFGLHNGPVNVNNGQLIINTPEPIGPLPGQINVGSGGQVVLSSGTIGSNATAIVQAGGGISGSSAALSALTVNGASAITLLPNSYVGHDTIDTSPAANPSGLGVVPQYIYAISADPFTLGNNSIAVGTGTNSPWIGFGSDSRDRTYGVDPSDAGAPVLTIVQTGVLAANGGDLTINARLFGGPGSIAQIRGNGVVTINSEANQFVGEVEVQPGASLRVNGSLPMVPSLTVTPGGSLGGGGAIGGNVFVQSDAVLDPGMNKFNNALDALTVGNLQLSAATQLDFEFGLFDNDTVFVTGALVLDGELIVNQLQDFDNQSTYTLFTYSGTLVDNGLVISDASQPINGVPAALAASILIIPNSFGPGGVVVLAIPEPAAVSVVIPAALLLRRRRV